MSVTTPVTRSAVEVAVLRSKAADLRASAAELGGPLARAYRRRAAEVELEAVALAARLGVYEPLTLAA